MDTMEKTGKFRCKKTSFTAASNTVLFDERLDMDTKTLHNMINYFISIPDFVLYKGHLQRVTGLGQRAFNRMWKQLKENGYLVQHKLKGEKGMFYYEYELFDEPQSGIEEKGKDFLNVHNASLEGAEVVSAEVDKMGAINNTLSNNHLNNKTINNKQQQEEVAVVSYHGHLPEVDAEVLQEYHEAFGQQPSPKVKAALRSFLQRFEKKVILSAVELAGGKGKGFDYAQGILKKLGSQGAYTFDEVFEYEEKYTAYRVV